MLDAIGFLGGGESTIYFLTLCPSSITSPEKHLLAVSIYCRTKPKFDKSSIMCSVCIQLSLFLQPFLTSRRYRESKWRDYERYLIQNICFFEKEYLFQSTGFAFSTDRITNNTVIFEYIEHSNMRKNFCIFDL